MAPVLYYNPISCVCQSVLLVTKAIGLDLELRLIDFHKGEHLTPEFVKLNPTHAVPFLIDGGTKIWESHAIIPYLIDKYANNHSLFPKDLAVRAQVNAFLHFDNAILYTRLRNMSEPLWQGKRKDVSQENLTRAQEAYQYLEDLIGDGPWLLGDRLTIADICCLVNVVALGIFAGGSSLPKLTKWLQHCKKNIAGYDEIVATGAKGYGDAIKQLMSA